MQGQRNSVTGNRKGDTEKLKVGLATRKSMPGQRNGDAWGVEVVSRVSEVVTWDLEACSDRPEGCLDRAEVAASWVEWRCKGNGTLMRGHGEKW